MKVLVLRRFSYLIVVSNCVCVCVAVICRCKPDAETYNALINAHGRAGQWRWAINIMDDMLRAAVCTLYFLPLSIFSDTKFM